MPKMLLLPKTAYWEYPNIIYYTLAAKTFAQYGSIKKSFYIYLDDVLVVNNDDLLLVILLVRNT